jgi:hypothetical protein
VDLRWPGRRSCGRPRVLVYGSVSCMPIGDGVGGGSVHMEVVSQRKT